MAKIYTDKTRPKPYEVRWSWYDGDGERHSRKRAFQRLKNAEAHKRRVEQEIAANNGQTTAPERVTVKQWAETWFRDWQTTKRPKPRTVMSYRRIIDATILPNLGNRRLDALTPADVDDWIATITIPTRSAETVKKHFAVLRQMLNKAVRRRLITHNPAIGAEMPKDDHTLSPFQAIALDEQQVQDLAHAVGELEITKETQAPYQLMVEFMAYTGLRAAEVSGLTIADLRMLKGQIDVHRTLQKKACTARCDNYPACREPARRKDGAIKRNRKGDVPAKKRRCRACQAACTDGDCCWLESTTKNRERRTVDIPTRWLIEDMAAYLATHPHGPNGTNTPSAPLFPGRKVGGQERFQKAKGKLDWDRPWNRGSFLDLVLRPAAEAAGLSPKLRLHDLRHTAGSIMLDVGMTPVDVAAQLGHSLEMLLRVYAHKISHDPEAIRDKFSSTRPARSVGGGAKVTALKATAGA